jgi:hypothetical protein
MRELRRTPLPGSSVNKLPDLRKRLHFSAMDRILSLIEQYGYLVILFGVMLESTGVPLPGETILLAAGVLVQRGRLDLGDVIEFGILGGRGRGPDRLLGRQRRGTPVRAALGPLRLHNPQEVGTRRSVLREAWG